MPNHEEAGQASTPDTESLRMEYGEVCSSWRFFTGIRFALLTFATTLLSILVTGYQFVVVNEERFGMIARIGMFIIPAFGGVCTYLIMLIEERARNLYGACLVRGKRIEEILNLSHGHFHQLWSAPLPWGMSHTKTIRSMYGLAVTASIVGVIFSIVRMIIGR